MNGLRSRTHQGFTVVEVLVVIVLVGVAAAAVVPRMMRSMDRMELRETCARVAQTARAAREFAITYRCTSALEIDIDAGGYGVSMESAQGGRRALQASWLKREKWPESVRVAGVRGADGSVQTSGTARVTFAMDGTSSGGVIMLASRSESRRVLVQPHTGRIETGDEETLSSVPDQVDLGD